MSKAKPVRGTNGTGPSNEFEDQSGIDIDRITNSIRSDLQSALPQTPSSLRAIVESLKPDIRKARANGLSWKDAAAIFGLHGISINAETLRVYTGTAAPTRAARGRRRAAQIAGTNSPTPPVATDKVTAQSSEHRHDDARADGARISPRVK